MRGNNMLKGFQYKTEETFLHRIHPLAKSVFLVLFLLSALSQKRWYDPILLFLVLVALSFLANINLINFLLRSRFLLFTGLFIILVQIFARPQGTILFYLIPRFLPYIGGHIPVTVLGLTNGLNLFGRFVTIISSSFLFVQTTEPEKFSVAFQQLKIPYRYSYALIIALRFVPLFDFEASQIMKSMSVRGVEFNTKMSITRSYKLFKYTFIPLIISTLNRSDDLAISMQLRGFGAYKTRTSYKPINYTWRDPLVIFMGILLPLLIYF